MAISHSIPSTLRRPGTYHELDTSNAAQGLAPLANRILLIAMMNPGASATADEAVQLFDDDEGDAKCGVGSEIALMAREAFEFGRRLGFQPEIWIAPVIEPVSGTAAIHTITVSVGTAAAAGDIVFRVGNELFRAGVSAGDSQDDAATAIKGAIDAKLSFVPVTASVAAGVVTLTQTFKGGNGNDLKVIIDDVGKTNLSIATATPTPGVGISVLTTALDNSLAKNFEVIAIANHLAADVSALGAHLDEAWAPDEKRWRFAAFAENGTLATCTGLTSAANDYRQIGVSYEESTSTPGQIAAEAAVMIAAREKPNYNWDDHDMYLGYPPDSAVYQNPEVESALSAGATPIVPNDARDGAHCVRLITTDSTLENLKDVAILRGFVYVIRQLDEAWKVFKAVNKSAKVLRRMRSVALERLLRLEEEGVVQNVEALFPLLIIEADGDVATRAVASIPESIVPNLHQSVLKHVLYVE